jgi:hypothetical protein
MLFTVSSTGRFERKPYSSLVLKILTKKIGETRKLINTILHYGKNEGRKPDKISSLKRPEFMPRNLD